MCNFTRRTAVWELKDSKTCSAYSASQFYRKDIETQDSLSVSLNAVSHVNFVKGQSQKKDVSPVIVPNYKEKLKYVKGVSCVTQLSCVQPVTNVKNAAQNLPAGARLQNFWQTWRELGAGPKVV